MSDDGVRWYRFNFDKADQAMYGLRVAYEPIYTRLRDSRVCLECWRSYRQDPFHFDCSGDYDVSAEEAAELREWLTGRYYWMIQTGQRAA